MDRQQEYGYIIKYVEENKLNPISHLFETETKGLPSDDWKFNELYHLKSLWTAYCLHNDLTCDTADYDGDVLHLFNVLAEQNPQWNNVEFDQFELWLGSYIC